MSVSSSFPTSIMMPLHIRQSYLHADATSITLIDIHPPPFQLHLVPSPPSYKKSLHFYQLHPDAFPPSYHMSLHFHSY